MCGIFGVVRFDGHSVSTEKIELSLQRMAYRGPDDRGVYVDQHIAMGMCRLAIIDPASGHQPISNEDETIWVVLNGEIYNYLELRSELIAKGHQFKTQSDTEVIVHLYEEYGLNAVQYLNGMFAFFLYDKKRERTWIVRDRLGIKPLYFYKDLKSIAFSSDLSSLMLFIGKKPLSSWALSHYLAFNYFPNTHSVYEDVEKLLPSEQLIIENNVCKRSKYWRLERIETFTGTYQEALLEVDRLLTDSIEKELRSDVPLAVSLSGGIDSSAIVAYAASKVSQLKTYSINFTGKEGLDSLYAKEVAKQYHTEHHEIQFSHTKFFSHHEMLMARLDEPVADSAIYASYVLAQQVRTEGVKVLLSGAGGDEIFGGYYRHFPPSLLNYKQLYTYLPIGVKKNIGKFLRIINPGIGWRIADPKVNYGVSTSGAQLSLYNWLGHSPLLLHDIINHYTIELKELDEDPYARMQVDLKHYLVGDVLALFDKSTMAASIEGRVPLLDHRLVEFAFSLPQKFNVGRGQKGLFKEVLSGKLPQNLLKRKKEGFNAPLEIWLQQVGLNKIKGTILANYQPLFSSLFQRARLEKILNGEKFFSRGSASMFNLYFLSLWYETVGRHYSQ